MHWQYTTVNENYFSGLDSIQIYKKNIKFNILNKLGICKTQIITLANWESLLFVCPALWSNLGLWCRKYPREQRGPCCWLTCPEVTTCTLILLVLTVFRRCAESKHKTLSITSLPTEIDCRILRLSFSIKYSDNEKVQLVTFKFMTCLFLNYVVVFVDVSRMSNSQGFHNCQYS